MQKEAKINQSQRKSTRENYLRSVTFTPRVVISIAVRQLGAKVREVVRNRPLEDQLLSLIYSPDRSVRSYQHVNMRIMSSRVNRK